MCGARGIARQPASLGELLEVGRAVWDALCHAKGVFGVGAIEEVF